MSENTVTDSTSVVSNEVVERTRDSLRGLGEFWANYGLNVARTTLEASAKTLQTTAHCLGELSHGLIGDRNDDPKGAGRTS